MDESVYSPGPTPGTLRTAAGEVVTPPANWELVPPGDPALTRRIKAAGEYWAVAEKRGRRVFSQGLWAPTPTVQRLRSQLDGERSDPAYAKRRQADAARREVAQAAYVEDFTAAVQTFLAFHPRYEELGRRLAKRIADHATPVGSGTVARTARIPVEQRAEAAVIAWMRHQTTAYDSMVIPRIKGKRREVRRMLARRSHELLNHYRRGLSPVDDCPLQRALTS